MSTPKGPVLIDLEGGADAAAAGPDTAPPVPDAEPGQGAPSRAAMQRLAAAAGAPSNPLARWFWRLLAALIATLAALALWTTIDTMIARAPVLGWALAALAAAFALICAAIAVREVAAFSRLSRIDGLQRAAKTAIDTADLTEARRVAARLESLYGDRDDLRWDREARAARLDSAFDADAVLSVAERDLLAARDAEAAAEVEAAARRVATVTALVPLALADVFAALTANLAMIRRIAEIYGGRSGTLGTWRMTRAVFAHLVATGAVAVGDDLIGSVAGGSVLSRVSRRFGEGVVNGALTARVGLAAMEVCRPLPFVKATRPSVTRTVRRALGGLFGGDGDRTGA